MSRHCPPIVPKKIKRETPRTNAELEALWREDPAFIGPVAPPMLMWFYRGRPKAEWELKAGQRNGA
jgi:hypothetical protein